MVSVPVPNAPPAGRLLPLAALAVLGTCWGASLALTKHATSSGHHPFGLLLWQLGIGTVLLGAIIVRRNIPVPRDARHLRWYALIAAVGTLVPSTASLFAYRHLPVSTMALLIATVPLLTLALAVALRAERLDPRRALGIALGTVALALIALPGASLSGSIEPLVPPDATGAVGLAVLVWIGVGLIAPLCYAVEGNVVATRTPPALSPIAALFGASVLGTLVAALAATLVGGHVDPFASWTGVEVALVLSAVGHTVAYAGYLWLLGRAGAVFASQIGYVVTLVGVAAGVALMGERPAVTVWLALPLMLLGVAMVRPRGEGRA